MTHNTESETPLASVPKHKFDCLVAHAKFQDATIAELRAHCHNLELYHNNEVWHWQHDGQDFLESLTCPVVIQPHHLRELIACAPEVRSALYRAELKKESDSYTQRLKGLADQFSAEFINYKAQFTYSSSQSTNCAGCGEHKHTPLRVDGMDGYVCLTCIDKRLGELLAEDSARHVEKDWDGCQEVADLPAVHEALAAFSADSTGDAGVAVVQAVIEALELKQAPPSLELTDDVRWILGQMCFQHIHTAQALRVMGYQIARKAEDEQAVTLHWMLTHYLRDPANWRGNASAEIKAGAEAHTDK